MTDFLPTSYEVPSSQSNYMKWAEGDNRFRILSSPIIGWEAWEDLPDGKRKPIRTTVDKPFTVDQVEDPTTIKHFWAMAVWDYQEEKIRILEITQKGIQRTLRALSKDPDWGTPVQTYDIVVTRKGKTLNDTEYSVLPKPAKKLDEGILQMYKDMTIDLTALYRGEDPFADKKTEKLVDEMPEEFK